MFHIKSLILFHLQNIHTQINNMQMHGYACILQKQTSFLYNIKYYCTLFQALTSNHQTRINIIITLV